jgi:hypothetical protein
MTETIHHFDTTIKNSSKGRTCDNNILESTAMDQTYVPSPRQLSAPPVWGQRFDQRPAWCVLHQENENASNKSGSSSLDTFITHYTQVATLK